MNYTGFSSPELDRFVDEAARTLDMSRRKALLHGAMRQAMDDLPFVPLYVDQDLYAFRSGVDWRPRNDNFLIASEIVRGR
jgi:ABC-type transport system substrate-binding protein